MPPLGLGICFSDLDRLLPFYISVLRFRHIGTLEIAADVAAKTGLSLTGYRVARLQSSYGERLKLLEPVEPPRVNLVEEQLLARRSATYFTLYRNIVADLEAMVGRLKAAGVSFLKSDEPVPLRPGSSLVFLRDPEGNVLEFVTYDDLAAYPSGSGVTSLCRRFWLKKSSKRLDHMLGAFCNPRQATTRNGVSAE